MSVLFLSLSCSLALTGCCLSRAASSTPCLARQGCPQVRALSACQLEDQPSSFSELMVRAQELEGQLVTVRATLQQGQTQCTELYCGHPDTCCNSCWASLFLAESEHLDDLDPGSLRLAVSDPQTTQLGCSGDDSLVCCPLEVGVEVVASGRLIWLGESSQGRLYQLMDPILCRPGEE